MSTSYLNHDSKGRPIGQTPAAVEAFWTYFGNSAAKDARGAPLVLYHGTPDGGFAEFSHETKGSRTGHHSQDVGFHFTTDPRYAETYSGGYNLEMIELYRREFGSEPAALSMPPGASTYPVYVSIQNPMRVGPARLIDRALITRAKDTGHDGIIADMGGALEFVVFDPRQIKSAIGNSGSFDVSSPSLTDGRDLELGMSVIIEGPSSAHVALEPEDRSRHSQRFRP